MTVEAAAPPRPLGGRYDRQFYTGMAVAAAVTVFIGFAPTFFLRGRYQATELPLYLRVHGFIFTSWIVLFFTQTSLVAARKVAVHRRLGWATAGLAVLMVIVGTTAGILSMRGAVDAGQGDAALSFLTTPLLSMTVFATLVGAAIALRRQPATHKRLMLLATISILDAPMARFPFEFLRTSAWAYIPLTDLLLVAVILYDVASRRRVDPAYIWGSLLIVAGQVLRIPLGETEFWKTIARGILGS